MRAHDTIRFTDSDVSHTRLDLSRTEQRGGPRPSSWLLPRECRAMACQCHRPAPTDQTSVLRAEPQRARDRTLQAPGRGAHTPQRRGRERPVPSAQHQQHRPTDTRLGPPNLDCIHRGTVTLELPIDNAHPQEPRRDELVRARCTPGASRFLPPLFYRQCGLVLLSFIPMLMHV